MRCLRVLVRTFFAVILLVGLVAGIFLSTLASVYAEPVQQAISPTDCLGSTIAKWTFDGGVITPSIGSGMFSNGSGITGPTFPLGSTGSGTDQAIGFTGFTLSPPLSTSDNHYIEFDVSTQGRTSMSLSFEYRSTSTGPTKMDVYYSVDGTTFSLLSSSNTLQNDSNWHSLPSPLDFSTITALNDNPNSKFKLYTYSASAGTGTFRLDNLLFSGSCINPANTSTFTPTDTPTATDTSTPTLTQTNTPILAATVFPPLSVVINEVAWGGTLASSSDEWIELYNPGTSDINLSGWTLRSLDNSPNILLTGTIAAKGYYLLARSGTTFSDLTVDQTFTGTLNNNGETLQLLDPNHYQIDTANQSGGAWPAGSASPNYASMERYYPPGGSIPPDGPSAWVTFAGTNVIAHDSSGNPIHGTPGTANWALTVTETPSSTTTTTPTPTSTSASNYPPLSLAINEVGWAGTAASSNDEWVEFYNPGSSDINLSGWDLDGVNSYYTSGNFSIPLNGTISAHSYFVLAENSKVFQNVTISQTSSSLSLLNSYQALQLISPADTLIDTANYSDSYYWPAGSASPNYASMERYYPPGGSIPADGPSAWVTFAGPTTSTPLDRNGNHVLGTPGGSNWASTVTETPSPLPTATRKPTLTPAPTPIPAVVINEILPRPGSDWNGDGLVNNYDEFIEVENLGPGVATLTNWRLKVTPNGGSGSFILPSLKLNPNERAVFYGSTLHLHLEDSGDTVSLTDTSGVIEDVFTYPAAVQPDEAWCRIRDGIGNWRDGCFPTPGLENAVSGIFPPAASQAGQKVACQLPDVAPDGFRLAECNSVGADIWNQQYWNDLSGQNEYVVPDPNNKEVTYIQ